MKNIVRNIAENRQEYREESYQEYCEEDHWEYYNIL